MDKVIYEGLTEGTPSHLPIYPHSLKHAKLHGELDLWRESSDLIIQCAGAIDREIKRSNYELYHYDLETAAKAVIAEYGTERVTLVLATVLQRYDYDARYSDSNRRWAKEFSIPKDWSPGIATHPAVMNGFIDKARTILEELEKDKALVFADVQGYQIKQAVLFENDRGFALAESNTAPSKFVTWQYTEENGARDFYWGHYGNSEDSARSDYAKRVGNYKADYGFAEKYNYPGSMGEQFAQQTTSLAVTEMSTEQNYNMIDGSRNNLAVPKVDLTDGQTHEEIAELAPDTLPEEKPSVVGKIREARSHPEPGNAKKHTRSNDEREL